MSDDPVGLWQKVRSGVMFGLGCALSPCCTPLIVPLLLALIAGTPAAAWIGTHLGWVYGILTLISVISFALGLRWMSSRKLKAPKQGTQPIVMRDLTGRDAVEKL